MSSINRKSLWFKKHTRGLPSPQVQACCLGFQDTEKEELHCDLVLKGF